MRRKLNRVPPPPPKISRRSAELVNWTGPVADDAPPPEAFSRLDPAPMVFQSIRSSLAHPELQPDGHSKQGHIGR